MSLSDPLIKVLKGKLTYVDINEYDRNCKLYAYHSLMLHASGFTFNCYTEQLLTGVFNGTLSILFKSVFQINVLLYYNVYNFYS